MFADKDGRHEPLDLEARALERPDVIPQGCRSIGASEDVLVEEQAPDEILVLPGLSETRQLNIHGAVILEHVVALAEKGGELSNADVLAHFELRDLVVLLLGGVPVVHAQNPALLLRNARVSQHVIAPGGAILGNGDAGNLCSVVYTGKLGQRAPARPNVQKGLALLELELLAHNGHLVVLELLQRLLTRRVRDDAAGVNHAGAEEPGIVIVSGVVVGADLLHVLVLGVEEHVGPKGEQNVLEQIPREAKLGPVVAVLEHVQDVALEISLAINVHFRKGLDGHFVGSAPLGLVGGILEGHVRLNGAARQLDMLIDARAKVGHVGPVGNQNGEKRENAKEDGRLEAAAHEAAQEVGHAHQEDSQNNVGEALAPGALSRQRGIVDGRRLELQLAQGH